MAQNEVVVRMRGDNTDLNDALKSSDSSIDKWAGRIKGVLAGVAVAFAAKKLFDIGASFVAGAEEEARELTKLEAVIKATGGAAGISSEQFQALATQAQKYTGVADEIYIKNAAVMATFKNIKGDVFKDAMKSAMDMSAVMDGDLSGSVMQISKALNDPIEGIGALSRAGVQFTDSQKEMIKSLVESGDTLGAQKIILKELESQFGGAAEALNNTFGGQMNQVSLAIGDMGDAIGEALIPYLEILGPVVSAGTTALGNLLTSVLDLTGVAEDFKEGWTTYLVDTLKWSVGIAADTFSFFEWAFVNFGKVIERNMFAGTLSVVSFANDLEHLLTKVIPAYLSWFGENWFNILLDIGNFTDKVFTNMWKNVSGFFTSLWSWLSGNEASFEWTALTDGFQSSLTALPEIANRELGTFEKYLMDDIKRMDKEMGQSWNNIFDKNRKAVDDMFAQEELPPIDLGQPEVKPEIKPPDKEKVKETKDSIEKQVDPKVEVNTVLGSTTGLEDLNKAITDASRSASDTMQNIDSGRGKVFVAQGAGSSKDRKGVAKVGDKEAGESAGESGNILQEIYNLLAAHHPLLLRTIKTSGGLA